jgi:hypothetical protein
MVVASLIMNAWFFWRYDVAGVDWLFTQEAKKSSGIGRRVASWLRTRAESASQSRHRVIRVIGKVVRQIMWTMGNIVQWFVRQLQARRRLAVIISTITKFAIFVVASINIDPVIVAVHYRESHFNGISLRDWGILFVSTAIGNLWWGARIGIIVEILKLTVSRF